MDIKDLSQSNTVGWYPRGNKMFGGFACRVSSAVPRAVMGIDISKFCRMDESDTLRGRFAASLQACPSLKTSAMGIVSGAP